VVASAPGMCIVEGCGKPQHCTGQLTYRWCKSHRDARLEESRAARQQQDTPGQRRARRGEVPVLTCVEAGCTAPRMVGPKSGKTLTRCEAHQQKYDREAKAEKRLANGVTQTTAVTPRASKAQPQSSVIKRRSKKAAPVKVMLLDYQSDTIRLLTVKSEIRVPMSGLRRGEPQPNTVGLYKHMGYQVADVRCPEQVDTAITLQRIIQRARWYVRHTPDLPAPIADTLLRILEGKYTLPELVKDVFDGLTAAG
jgi:hypothetical protein